MGKVLLMVSAVALCNTGKELKPTSKPDANQMLKIQHSHVQQWLMS